MSKATLIPANFTIGELSDTRVEERTQEKSEVKKVKKSKTTKRYRAYIPAVTIDLKPVSTEVLAELEQLTAQYVNMEEWSKKMRRIRETRGFGRYEIKAAAACFHTSGPVCKKCGVDYLDIPLVKDGK